MSDHELSQVLYVAAGCHELYNYVIDEKADELNHNREMENEDDN